MPRYMLLQNFSAPAACTLPMSEWAPADVTAHIDFQVKLNGELAARGELIDAQALAGPDLARYVTCAGAGAPVVTDGPNASAKELLAGYRIVEVDSQARALEIAAKVSAAPGPGGAPIRQRIEVRQVMDPVGVDP